MVLSRDPSPCLPQPYVPRPYTFITHTAIEFVQMTSSDLINNGSHLGGQLTMPQNLKPIFHCDTKPVGPGVGLYPQCHNFALEIPTYWYLKMRKFAFFPTPNLKFVLPPERNPNASQWNIRCVGYQTQISHVGHVHFMFCC